MFPNGMEIQGLEWIVVPGPNFPLGTLVVEARTMGDRWVVRSIQTEEEFNRQNACYGEPDVS